MRARRERLTLVDTPLMKMHHPWVSYSRGAFSNRSLVLHPIKDPNSSIWSYAARRSAGKLEPFERVCKSCAEMGWSTYQGSEANAWRCCGLPHASRSRRITSRKELHEHV